MKKENIIDILKKERIKDDKNIDTLLDKIYEELLKGIKFKNKHGITNTIYEIPPIFPGFPLFDKEIVTYKLNKMLKKKGFKTTMNNTKIYISWG